MGNLFFIPKHPPPPPPPSHVHSIHHPLSNAPSFMNGPNGFMMAHTLCTETRLPLDEEQMRELMKTIDKKKSEQ
ncbi:Os10g0394700 [Oryza sativa Japonica Group]|uniref:Uncharacterized protein n=2 Tax=Oryza sativa subsp. japonica TaxID=39947 RepID=A0A8J8YIM4_ORYSJ|nr:hypothetical protein OsJ_31409 [Oryza sativa Japonica Group]KAF2913439.1 hypothetical protein DAI22_10g084600 [Oryza sativa Japonica Group]BAT10695.1 Os10g0394700 [Oryza sativa Japonica Group]